MGACSFNIVAKGKTAKEAFNAAVEKANYDHGHAGYTGTIAEKQKFVMITAPRTDMTVAELQTKAEQLIDAGDHRIDDKWGPAGCFAGPDEQWVFFGWASS